MLQFLHIQRITRFPIFEEMAKVTVTVAVVFLFLAVSHAHFQEVDLAEHDAPATVKAISTSSEKDQKAARAITLPSEDVGSEPANLKFNAEYTESQPDISEVESAPDSHTVPLTMISFRPINRHFPRRPLLPLHHRHRLNCRQGRQFRPWNPRLQNKAIPFGDDMVTSDDGMNFDTVLRGGVRNGPGRWVRFHRRHEGPRFIFRDEAIFRGPRHFNEKEDNEIGEQEQEQEHHHRHKEEQKGGLLKSFRKFLNHF